jgi:predicted DNA-binding ribbon-helix-helix protein
MKRRKTIPVVRRSRIVRRSIVINGHHTSVTLEEEFWIGLKEIAEQRRTMLSVLIDAIDIERAEHDHKNLSSALRVFVLDFYRSKLAMSQRDD